MRSTTEQTGFVAIEGQPLVRDLQSKAVLSYDRKALLDSRRQRQQKQLEISAKLETKAEIAKLNKDVAELKNDISEIRDLLKNALSPFINTIK